MKLAKVDKETRVGVLYGGLSEEREVSLRSGKNCFDALKRLGYKNAQLIDVNKDLAQTLQENQTQVAFLCLHGRYGEDGTVQGLLELLGIPYTGSGVVASALGMSKPLTKQLLKANDIPYPQSFIIKPADLVNFAELEKRLPKPPLMIKPLNEGSSVGVSKINEAHELQSALSETVSKYGGAIVERYINGQEITVGILEELKANGSGQGQVKERKTYALPILELRPKSKAGFYDYEAKYTEGMTEFILPAELSKETTELAKSIAVKTFETLSCSGYSRVDMMVDKQGQPYVLEVNTLPGMTDLSDLPAMAKHDGMSYDQLVECILKSAGLDK